MSCVMTSPAAADSAAEPTEPAVPLPWMHIAKPRRGPVRAMAIVLHGGRERSTARTRPWQAAVLRLIPFDLALRRAGRARGLAVVRIRYRARGWNTPAGGTPPSVADVRAALRLLAELYPGAPIAVIGHSMGGRTAMYVGADAAVSVVVGLAPWITPTDPYRQLRGKDLLIVHGTADRLTDPRASAHFVDEAAGAGARASYIGVLNGRHSMLRAARFWHRVTAEYVTAALSGLSPARFTAPQRQSASDPTASLGREAARGGLRVVVSPTAPNQRVVA